MKNKNTHDKPTHHPDIVSMSPTHVPNETTSRRKEKETSKWNCEMEVNIQNQHLSHARI
jgi:hypothetical protein